MKTVLKLTFMGIIFPLFTHAQSSLNWKNGLSYKNEEAGMEVKFGGIIMYDMAFFSPDDAFGTSHVKSGAEFRRARLYTSGKVYGNIKFKMQLDMTGGDVDFKDMYIDFTKVPGLGNIRVGQMKEPFRLEGITSSKYITFMERANTITLQQERNSGIMIHNTKDNFSYHVGFFRNTDSYGDSEEANGSYNLTGRFTTKLDFGGEDKTQFIHLGAAGSYRNVDSYKISARPVAHLAPKYFNIGTISELDNVVNLGLEFAYVMNSFSLQGEFMNSSMKSATTTSGDVNVNAFYAYASYFLTGESRSYKGSAFGRVKPKSIVGKDGGKGAWEIALRYSSIDSDIELAPALNDITLGVNWYLNSASRIMANYVLASTKDADDDTVNTSIFQTRFQIDF